MENKIVKAEILWTRACNLRCSYCSMYYYNKLDKNKDSNIVKDWSLWKKGLQNLKELGCGFTAIYGAEPLMDMEYLPELFQELNNLQINHTLITNCTLKDTKERLSILQKSGLNSLTVSFDGEFNENQDMSSKVKSENGLKILYWFRDNFPVRDSSVVFTLTRTNYKVLIPWIEYFAKENIHVFFDLIHNDIGNPGTKCRNYKGIENLLFTHKDIEELKIFSKELMNLKKDVRLGKFIHQSKSFLSLMMNNPSIYIDRLWNCSESNVFPSWLTIDYDGKTRVCDDFHYTQEEEMYFWNLDFKEFEQKYRPIVKKHCKGCLWNTHYDAHMIKSGVESFSDYMNGKEEFKSAW